MKTYRITGGNPLKGEVCVNTSKNSMLPILAACILCKEDILLRDVPDLGDIRQMRALMEALGARVMVRGRGWVVNCAHMRAVSAPVDVAQRFRASFLVVGPLLARFGQAAMPFPGGCSIGARPVDMHIKGFAAMGARCQDEDITMVLEGKRLRGETIYLDYPSVGATENIMMAAALAKGTTTIVNAAREPEIGDLARFLQAMGAQICGEGTGMIAINGVESLHGCTYRAMPDRIEAGTFMYAAAVSAGDITLRHMRGIWVKPVIAKLSEGGAIVDEQGETLRVACPGHMRAVHVKTMPWPGFPTDLQPQAMVLAAISRGVSVITETVFENRYAHAGELLRMGADIAIRDKCAVIQGAQALHGARVRAGDLRAGAALVLAGLAAVGRSEIAGTDHIERGYESLPEKLASLGADIKVTDTHIDHIEPYTARVLPGYGQ